ncbi:hypothetical protein XF30_28135 [Bradyrhizobium sp. SUTN9-2]|nr:hypothetical protein XF30_28135 [Bradyrhizobium sp. SUTN9-2]
MSVLLIGVLPCPDHALASTKTGLGLDGSAEADCSRGSSIQGLNSSSKPALPIFVPSNSSAEPLSGLLHVRGLLHSP